MSNNELFNKLTEVQGVLKDLSLEDTRTVLSTLCTFYGLTTGITGGGEVSSNKKVKTSGRDGISAKDQRKLAKLKKEHKSLLDAYLSIKVDSTKAESDVLAAFDAFKAKRDEYSSFRKSLGLKPVKGSKSRKGKASDDTHQDSESIPDSGSPEGDGGEENSPLSVQA